MSDLEDFLGLKDVKSIRKTVSVELDGKRLDFVIRPLTQQEHAEFQKRCLSSLSEATTFDTGKYNSLMLDACIVEPNFSNADFLHKAGCNNAAEFRNRKFTTGFLTALANEINELSGFNTSFTQDIETAKN